MMIAGTGSFNYLQPPMADSVRGPLKRPPVTFCPHGPAPSQPPLRSPAPAPAPALALIPAVLPVSATAPTTVPATPAPARGHAPVHRSLVTARCSCRAVMRTLSLLPEAELEDIIVSQEVVEAKCEFCGKRFRKDSAEIKEELERRKGIGQLPKLD